MSVETENVNTNDTIYRNCELKYFQLIMNSNMCLDRLINHHNMISENSIDTMKTKLLQEQKHTTAAF